MRLFNNYLTKLLFFVLLLNLNQCSDPAPREMTKGHMDAIKEQCKNDPDKKLCGKEVRLKFKRDGHKYVTFEEFGKDEKTRIIYNCKSQLEYGLVTYNECLREKKQLALGNNLTNQDGEPRITSNIDKLKQYVYRIIAHDVDEQRFAGGSGVAIAKNLIATNCHVVLDDETSKKRNKAIYYDIIRVINLHDENKRGQVTLFKKGYEKDLDICILKTKSDLKYVKTKVKHSKLKQRMKVLAIGSPIQITGLVTDGKITALKTWGSGPLDPALNKGQSIEFKIPWKVIHHDAAIGGGSSGGPLFNSGGELIGLNTIGFMERTTGAFSLALSADHINDVLRD
jgi:S1-C subfamily serine protease